MKRDPIDDVITIRKMLSYCKDIEALMDKYEMYYLDCTENLLQLFTLCYSQAEMTSTASSKAYKKEVLRVNFVL